jgi:ABC-2 type transport system ATP-binding protein
LNADNVVLSVRGLQKRYGNLEAVGGIDFRVHEGEIYGLIGPNGAGKTTTLRIVATILRPSGGTLTIDGLDAGTDAPRIRDLIAYLPEEAGAYKSLRGEDYLRFSARIFFDDKQRVEQAVSLAADVSGLGPRLRDKIGTYSKGMTRKLLLARTVMTGPRLAILDEPTSGLDVLNALEIRNRIKGMAREGMSVLLSSHNMLEIEFLSDRVGLLYKGLIRDEGTPSELRERYGASNLEEVFRKLAAQDGDIAEALAQPGAV